LAQTIERLTIERDNALKLVAELQAQLQQFLTDLG
jgi:hypothetical protein